MMIRRLILNFCILLITACQPATTPFLNANITGSHLQTQVPLIATDGQILQLNAPHSAVTALFFGFTSCPDACPTTLGRLKIVKQQLDSEAKQLRVIFVSLDPERDRTDVIKQYVDAFGSDFVGASTDLAHTQIMGNDLGVAFEKVGSEPFYMIKHSANLYLLDQEGRFRVSIPYEASVESITHDVKQLINEKH